jgi:choline monooxygenase
MTTKPLHLDVNEQIECAQTLASRFYTDPHILEIEREKIFRRTWQLVGTLDQPCGEVVVPGEGAAEGKKVKRTIADPESYFTADVAGEPIIVVRDKEGVLRAFSNVCRHRAGPIALGSGCKNVLRCQYHGWTYTLDGRLIGTPDVEGVEFFDRSTMGMVPLRLEVWEDFIFVSFHLNADDEPLESLATYLGKIPEQARGFQFAGLQLAERRDYVINCNWKVYVDNYLEGYHIPIVHPSLFRELDYPKYWTETKRMYSIQHAPVKRSERLRGDDDVQYYWIFPNLMLNVYADNFSTNLILPLGHGRTRTVFEWFFRDPEQARREIDSTIAFSDEIQIEDIGICEAVQRGLASATYDSGRYSPQRENGVHHFHGLYAGMMAIS